MKKRQERKQKLLALIDRADNATIVSLLEQLNPETEIPILVGAVAGAAAESTNPLFDALAEQLRGSDLEHVRLEAIPETDTSVRLMVSNINPDQYEDFLKTVLLCGCLPSGIAASVFEEIVTGHPPQKIPLFAQLTHRRDWLNALVAYEADTKTVQIIVGDIGDRSGAKESYTPEKGQRLIENLISYYEDDMPLDTSILIDENEQTHEENFLGAEDEKLESVDEIRFSALTMDSDSEEGAVAASAGSADSAEALLKKRSTDSSSPRLGKTTRADEPFVRASVNAKGDVVVSIGKSRPKTKYKTKQGEHVSAYTAFIHFVLNAVEATPLPDIPLLLYSYARCFLPKEAMTSLKTKYDVFRLRKTDDYLTREERKVFTKRLREQGVSRSDIDIIKINLKRGYATFIADILTELAVHVIQTANLQENATFLTVGAKDGAEGSRVQMAMKALSALDKLVELQQEDDETRKITLRQQLHQEKRLREGLKNFQRKEIQKENAKAKKKFTPIQSHIEFIENLINPDPENLGERIRIATASELSTEVGLFSHGKTSKRPALEATAGSAASASVEIPETILQQAAEFVMHLFDFNYYRRLSTVLLSDPDLSGISREVEALLEDDAAHQQFIIAVKSWAHIKLSENEKTVADALRESNFQCFVETLDPNPLKEKCDLEEGKLFEELKKVCQTHIGLIMATFRHLMKENNFATIVDNFIIYLKENSWGNYNKCNSLALYQSLREGIEDLSEDTPDPDAEDQKTFGSETGTRPGMG